MFIKYEYVGKQFCYNHLCKPIYFISLKNSSKYLWNKHFIQSIACKNAIFIVFSNNLMYVMEEKKKKKNCHIINPVKIKQ